MQLRAKKDAFNQAFGDVMRMKSWYFGSRVALRKQPHKFRKPVDFVGSPLKSPRLEYSAPQTPSDIFGTPSREEYLSLDSDTPINPRMSGI
jgi:hypothetical protein